MTSNRGPLDKQEFIGRLLSPERAETLDPLVIMSFCPINIHDTVADIGCGPGFFTLPLAKVLVNGKLYALDIDDEMLAACREKITQARMGNVEILKCGEFEFPLEPASVDGAFLAFVVQASPDKPRLLHEVRELIRPRGWCTVLEWYRKETEYGPPLERRIEPDELVKVAESAGFRPRGWRDINGDNYMMTLRRR
ncbi:MAG: class I SAM-dependent methyltransferase [Chloroflexi bacterium]|nr:class I SAM-dependent methyltransferase [Chloroflexota bacterium]